MCVKKQKERVRQEHSNLTETITNVTNDQHRTQKEEKVGDKKKNRRENQSIIDIDYSL